MRMRHAAVVAGLALGLMSGAAKAASLEYDVFIPLSGDTVTGTIETDGRAGTLSSSDILSYDLFYENAEINSSDPTASVFTNGNLVAVGSDLTFSFDDSLSDLRFSNSSNRLELNAGFPDVFQPFIQFNTSSGNATSNASVGSVLTIAVSEGTAMSTVPLPASAPMFGAAVLALGAVGYGLKRKGKTAA